VGLAVLAALRWRVSWTAAASLGVVAVGVAVILIIPGAVKVDLGSSKSADVSTSGRYHLVEGGVRLAADRPIAGYGSGSFARRYRRAEKVSAERATSASHTIPVTVAAEQGAIGLAAYLALLALALVRLLRHARGVAARAAVAAGFCALVAHSFMYAAFLEDPLTWTLLGLGTALALLPARPPSAPAPPPPLAEPAPA
jgi:O-antigen ligase